MPKLEALKRFRLSQRLTQQEMADLIGVRRVKYTKIELGYQPPSVDFIRDFKKAFSFLTAEQIQQFFLDQNSSGAETKLSPTGTES